MQYSKEILALAAMDCACITPAQAAPALSTDPNTLRWQARHNPRLLGFPVIVIKSRVKIPRLPLLEHLGYREVTP